MIEEPVLVAEQEPEYGTLEYSDIEQKSEPEEEVRTGDVLEVMNERA